MGGAEFPPLVAFVGHADEAAAPRARESAERRPLAVTFFRMFPVGEAAARFRAEVLGLPVRGEGPAAEIAGSRYVHRVTRSASKARKKGRSKSSLRMEHPGYAEVPSQVIAGEGAESEIRTIPPPSAAYAENGFPDAACFITDGAHDVHLLCVNGFFYCKDFPARMSIAIISFPCQEAPAADAARRGGQ